MVSKIAMKIATEAKSIGLAHDTASVAVDLGFYECSKFGGCDGLVTEAFDALLDEVDAALPLAKFDRRIAADWARAGADNAAEARVQAYGI